MHSKQTSGRKLSPVEGISGPDLKDGFSGWKFCNRYRRGGVGEGHLTSNINVL